MSKRDELKKLRSAQKSTHTDDTPAEDYSKNAAKALESDTAQEAASKNTSEKKSEDITPKEDKPALSAVKEAENVHTENNKSTDASPYSISNLPGKRISVSLKVENKNWMHRTAMRCGLSIQDYVNILIEEAWNREQKNPFVGSDDDPLPERIPSNQTVLVAIKLTNDNIERSKRLRAAHYMTMTGYMNYLIEEEIHREKENGMRPAIFDNHTL